MISQNEFAKMAGWSTKTLWLFCMQKTKQMGHLGAIRYLLRLRYALQKQLSIYSKKKEFDRLQLNAIRNIELMMKWCKQYYIPYATKEAIKQNHQYATKPRKIKSIVNGNWERLVRSSSY